MSSFKKYVNYCKTTTLSGAGVAASPEAIAQQHPYRGRHAVTITANSSAVYIGDESVVSGGGGIKLAAGESMTIPVFSDRTDQVYVSGACTITEWF